MYAASGRATLYSYIIVQRPQPGMGSEPYSIAVVTLDEGPRLLTNIVGCAQTPEALQLDMQLEVLFVKQSEDISLPFFRPAAT